MSQRDDNEMSPGGSRVLRHRPRERGFEAAIGGGSIEEIERHLAAHLGQVSTVLHEIVSDLVHVDVHLVPPSPPRASWTLFTTGMSDRPMTAPEGVDERHAELLLSLPADWRMDLLQQTPPAPEHERWYWPIGWLKQLARFPHEYDTWLGAGHTIPNGDPPRPFAPGTRLCCWLLLPPMCLPESALQLALADGRTVRFYALHALHPEEVSLKLNRGTDALLDELERAQVTEVLAPARPPVVRKKLFGLF